MENIVIACPRNVTARLSLSTWHHTHAHTLFLSFYCVFCLLITLFSEQPPQTRSLNLKRSDVTSPEFYGFFLLFYAFFSSISPALVQVNEDIMHFTDLIHTGVLTNATSQTGQVEQVRHS